MKQASPLSSSNNTARANSPLPLALALVAPPNLKAARGLPLKHGRERIQRKKVIQGRARVQKSELQQSWRIPIYKCSAALCRGVGKTFAIVFPRPTPNIAYRPTCTHGWQNFRRAARNPNLPHTDRRCRRRDSLGQLPPSLYSLTPFPSPRAVVSLSLSLLFRSIFFRVAVRQYIAPKRGLCFRLELPRCAVVAAPELPCVCVQERGTALFFGEESEGGF